MSDILDLQEFVMKLKTLKRKGWELRDIKDCESVADHSYATSMLVMIMAEKLNLNMEKCLKMALIHEIAEAKIGDITPKDDNWSQKNELENQTIKEIVSETGYTFITELWQEYCKNKSKEAKLVRDMDKIEMVIQALDYEKKYPGKDLVEFYNYVKDKLKLEESKQLFNEIIKKRS